MTDIRLSKTLSYLLRHGAEKEGIPISPDGFVAVDRLLQHPTLRNVTMKDINRVVESNDKQRYMLISQATPSGDKWMIRANQGHSMKVAVKMAAITSPSDAPVVVHGTSRAAYASIKKSGLKPMGRQHIHFAAGLPGAGGVISGMRASCQVQIYIDLERALSDGIPFFKSENGVILSPGDKSGCIPPAYFKQVELR